MAAQWHFEAVSTSCQVTSFWGVSLCLKLLVRGLSAGQKVLGGISLNLLLFVEWTMGSGIPVEGGPGRGKGDGREEKGRGRGREGGGGKGKGEGGRREGGGRVQN